jgi:hypothetical protein
METSPMNSSGRSSRTTNADDFDAEEIKEYERVRQETLNINSQLTGALPQQVIVLKSASYKQQFINKLKDRVSKNALIEAHVVSLQEDEEILE